MSYNIDKLHPAKFKEVEFLVNSTSISGGRKTIIHEYPNSDRQTIEDLGDAPRSYKITAFITGTDIDVEGSDYFQKRNRLINKLEESGPGTLIHPFYGIIPNVVARTYTINENMTNLGVATIEISFDVSSNVAIPVSAGVSTSQLGSVKDSCDVALTANITDNWVVSTSAIGSFEEAKEKLQGFSESFADSTKFLNNATDSANELTSLISDFNTTIGTLAQDPVALSDSISNMFSVADSASQSLNASVEAMGNLFDFGDDDAETIDGNTSSSIERLQNKNVMNNSIKAYALIYNYLNVPQKNYVTKSEIDSELESLETQFESIIDSDGIDDDSRDAIINMKTASLEFIEDVRVDTRRVISVKTNTLPMRSIAYQYYGDSTEEDNLNLINDDPNVSFISGTIGVLAE